MLKYVVSKYGEIGEVVNTVDCGSIMQGFDSLISPHIKNNLRMVKLVSFFCCIRIVNFFNEKLYYIFFIVFKYFSNAGKP